MNVYVAAALLYFTELNVAFLFLLHTSRVVQAFLLLFQNEEKKKLHKNGWNICGVSNYLNMTISFLWTQWLLSECMCVYMVHFLDLFCLFVKFSNCWFVFQCTLTQHNAHPFRIFAQFPNQFHKSIIEK